MQYFAWHLKLQWWVVTPCVRAWSGVGVLGCYACCLTIKSNEWSSTLACVDALLNILQMFGGNIRRSLQWFRKRKVWICPVRAYLPVMALLCCDEAWSLPRNPLLWILVPRMAMNKAILLLFSVICACNAVRRGGNYPSIPAGFDLLPSHKSSVPLFVWSYI